MAGLPKMKNRIESIRSIESRTRLLGFGIFISILIVGSIFINQVYGWSDQSNLNLIEDKVDLWRFSGATDYSSEGNFYVNNNTFYERFNFVDDKVMGRVEIAKSPTRGTNGFLLGSDFKIGETPIGNSSIGFKVNITNDNPVLEKAMLIGISAKWLPYWRLGGFDMGFNLTARGGLLNVDTETQPADPPYPSQNLGGGEAGLSIAKTIGRLSLSGGISHHKTYTNYDSVTNIDNFGDKADFGTQLNLSPFFVGAKWRGRKVAHNPDKYFFLDNMREDEYTAHLAYMRKRFDIGVFQTVYNREGIEFTEEKLLTGFGIGFYGWIFKGLLIKDLIGAFDSTALTIGKSFRDVRVEAYWVRDEELTETLNNNTVGFAFSYGLGKRHWPTSHPDSYKCYQPYNEGPFGLTADYQSFEETIENLDSLNKVVRYTRANVDYIYQTEKDKSPEEVFEMRGGDCDEQVFFQHYVLNRHDFGDIYEIGFQSPRMCHAFSYGQDKRTGEEYIWEYGRVFRLKFDDKDKLSLKEKVASILSSRNYSKDWEWFVTYGPELNYENYYDNDVIAAEGFRTAPELFSGDGGSVGIISESGIQLFIGEEFER